jgi:hypothetical protein
MRRLTHGLHGQAALAANTSGHSGRIFMVAWIFEANPRKGNSSNLYSLMIFFCHNLLIKKF